MADPEKYWPGGIPSHVRCHDNPIEDNFKEEVKGWQLFLEENVTARDGSSQEQTPTVTRRRQLVEEWASMSQDTRNSYQERAPLRDGAGWFPAELAANDQNYQPQGECYLIIPEPISPRNWALWTKIRILLYNHDGEEHGALWGGGESYTAICRPNPAGPNPVTVDGYNTWTYVEPALFEHMSMTSTGTVVFHYGDQSVFFADQETLDTGRLLLCAFDNNGSLEKSGRIWPVCTKDIHSFMVGLGHPASSLIEGDSWIFDEEAPPGDMEKPILEVMSTLAAECAYFDENERGVDLWREDIESYAPDYLEMEEAGGGMVVDYDHDKFRKD
ncbi:hypothetical protein VE03_07108 [Pseudogymnoascus sp. 23342-1-I1]|nr:hypothetical protein VE03_07108 [Pseudogymnoascus sp. 23342-1-I1]